MKSFLNECWNGFVANDEKPRLTPLPAKPAEGSLNPNTIAIAVASAPANEIIDDCLNLE